MNSRKPPLDLLKMVGIQSDAQKSNRKKEYALKDISKLSRAQLLEIRDRQQLLLENKNWLSKLPDKGERVIKLRDKICKELAAKDQMEDAALRFSELNIASTGKKTMTNLEWTGMCSGGSENAVLDSDDDDERDPLKLIAQSRDLTKRIKYIKEQPSLITADDIDEINSFNITKIDELEVSDAKNLACLRSKYKTKDDLNEETATQSEEPAASLLEPHALYLCDMSTHKNEEAREKFKPSYTTKSNVHDPLKECKKRHKKNWEATAATPPLLRCGSVKMLSLQESIELQSHQRNLMKNVLEVQASERLKSREKRLAGRIAEGSYVPNAQPHPMSAFFKQYRDPVDCFDEDEKYNSDDQVYDDDDDKNDRGGVSFPVHDE